MTDGSFHTPRTSIVALENTHNNAGGTVWPLDELQAVVATARELGLQLHLDGARLLNAAVASGVPARELGAPFDTVTLCLSKGLGCPLGALIAGSAAPDASRADREAPLRRRDAPGGHRRGRRPLRARPQRRAARRGSRACAAARRGLGSSAGCRSTSSACSRTSCRSTSQRSGSASGEALASALASTGVALSRTMRPGVSARGDAPRPRPTRTSSARSSSCRRRSEHVSESEPLDRLAAGAAGRPAPVGRGCGRAQGRARLVERRRQRRTTTSGQEATAGTQYRIGSITKTFTATAIMQLRDAGELDLDDRLEPAPRRRRERLADDPAHALRTSRACSARWARCS